MPMRVAESGGAQDSRDGGVNETTSAGHWYTTRLLRATGLLGVTISLGRSSVFEVVAFICCLSKCGGKDQPSLGLFELIIHPKSEKVRLCRFFSLPSNHQNQLPVDMPR